MTLVGADYQNRKPACILYAPLRLLEFSLLPDYKMGHIKQVLLLLTIAACFQLATFQSRRRLKEGDPCRLENKEKGMCRVLDACPAALKQLSDSHKWPLRCSQRADGVNIICCDENTNKQTPPTGTPTQANINGGKISRQKCDSYSRWVEVPTLLPGADEKVAGECANVAQFIIGGKEAEPLEFPHMAHLGFGDRNNLQWGCGGSLISEQYVLTAAHCLQKKDGVTNVSYVRLGSSYPRSTQIVKIKERIPHPQYVKTQLYNDIALLKLEEEIEFDNYKRPACLQVDHQFNENRGIASGWGTTENGTGSDKLLKVLVPFTPNAQCKEVYGVAIKLPNSIEDRTQFCAGAFQKDTCQGDSGGPMQISLKKPNCMYSILGVTSFGIGCGRNPGVYSRVSAFVPWIEKVVWGRN